MKLSEIYERAAEMRLQEFGITIGCCQPIYDALVETGMCPNGHRGEAFDYFAKWFKPSNRTNWWWDSLGDDNEPRVLALCFAAAIARSEGE